MTDDRNDTASKHHGAMENPANIVAGARVRGIVRELVNYGAFVEVAPKLNGLLHIKNLSWNRVKDITQVVGLGDEIDVKILQVDWDSNHISLGHKQLTPDPWPEMEEAFANGKHVEGIIQQRIRGGFSVILHNGLSAFLPATLSSVIARSLMWEVDKEANDSHPLVGTRQIFKLHKMNRNRHRDIIVLDRRTVEEEKPFDMNITEGDCMHGIVRQVVKYGAFVEIAPGICGLLHISDMSWEWTNTNEIVTIGDEIEVKILSINKERGCIQLGMKQLSPDPWNNVERDYPIGSRVRGTVGQLKDYGAFVHIGNVTGLLHSSEMSWEEDNVVPADIVSSGQEVEVMVIAVDLEHRRMSLSMKQCMRK